MERLRAPRGVINERRKSEPLATHAYSEVVVPHAHSSVEAGQFPLLELHAEVLIYNNNSL